MIPVTLYVHIMPHGSNPVLLKKPVELPIPPVPGMVLINVIRNFSDPTEHAIHRVDIDIETGEVGVFLPDEDYRDVEAGTEMTIEELMGKTGMYFWKWTIDG